MRCIRPWLHVGGYRDTLNYGLLSHFKVGAMLQLAESVPQVGITTRYLPFDDGMPIPPEVLPRALAFIREARNSHANLLIACGAGISRSVTIAIATLRETEGLGLVEAYRDIRSHHPEALPHPALWDSLGAHYGERISYRELLRERS
ncbi:MAG: dual specificity protein phosphatase family protein [Verrucomicrobiales bacterium]|nr:dual specificity protein phosphatase family protein [Verrucomicrobiales bacterium]